MIVTLPSVEGLTPSEVELSDEPRLDQEVKGPVDRRAGDGWMVLPEPDIEIISGKMALNLQDFSEDNLSLRGHPEVVRREELSEAGVRLVVVHAESAIE